MSNEFVCISISQIVYPDVVTTFDEQCRTRICARQMLEWKKAVDATDVPNDALGQREDLQQNFSVYSMLSLSVSLMATWEAFCSTMVTGLSSGDPVSLVYGFILAILGSLATAGVFRRHFYRKLSGEKYTSTYVTQWFNNFKASNFSNMASTKSNGFVSVSQWPKLEELSVGFDEHLMPASFALVDETISIKFEGHALIIHHFESETLLKWEVITGPEKSLKGTNKYKAFEVRPGNFFIDFYKPEFEEHVSLILNRSTGQVIAGLSRLDRTKAEQRTTTELVKFR